MKLMGLAMRLFILPGQPLVFQRKSSVLAASSGPALAKTNLLVDLFRGFDNSLCGKFAEAPTITRGA